MSDGAITGASTPSMDGGVSPLPMEPVVEPVVASMDEPDAGLDAGPPLVVPPADAPAASPQRFGPTWTSFSALVSGGVGLVAQSGKGVVAVATEQVTLALRTASTAATVVVENPAVVLEVAGSAASRYLWPLVF
ncbi:MAG: hypothetical protein H7Y33_08995, partial [Cytophagales bacterium]|nr:hypothetical protein [Rhizobacter sp.]